MPWRQSQVSPHRQQRREQFRRDMLAERADDQDKLFQEGDDRGTYGNYPPPASFRRQC